MKAGIFLFSAGLFMLYTTIKKPASKEDVSGLNFNGLFVGSFLIAAGVYLIFKDI